ncbi:hypothetical protein FRB94_009074 [Tulasnella sp. JGI-2019a]|nr:hypothetical protein FRB93_001683 [Tulasnella sp. JGI-2019a]KAG9011148.1 hypothetical protein FRB94_009074 [Tulasnella sp. JGI-2019a]KAG9032520.1 hypothetical protein FRB95_001356 [Tulasnella sp. JGI-2019a]
MSEPRPKSTALDRQDTYLRRVEKKTNANRLHPLPRISRAAGFAQLLAFPVILGYFVFYMPYGEKEHVFSEPRRWLERQKQGFWALPSSDQSTPESQRLKSSSTAD